MHIDKLRELLVLHKTNKEKCSFGKTSHLCDCGMRVMYNGISSHSKKCNHTAKLREDFFRVKYHIEDVCPCCSKEISIGAHSRLGTNLIFCSEECFLNARKAVSKYDHTHKIECVICGTSVDTLNEHLKTCSEDCCKMLLSATVSAWHEDQRTHHIEKYSDRNIKISNSSKGRVNVAWNKGISGAEYMAYYEKSDGTNSLYAALMQNDGWFRKTKPEMIFEEKLKEWECRYQYSFFTQHRQFDFLVSVDDYCFVVEVDGDYWHRSRRLEFSESEVLEKRSEDEEKAKLLLNLKSEKKFVLLRVWEYHVLSDSSIWNVFRDLFRGIEIGKNISKIEEYYRIYY